LLRVLGIPQLQAPWFWAVSGGSSMRKDFETTDPEAYVTDIIPKATDTKSPIAVTDEDNKLVGLVSVLSALIYV